MNVYTTSNEIYFKDPSGTEIYLVPVTAVQRQQGGSEESSQIVGVKKSDIVNENPGLWTFEHITPYVDPDPVKSHPLAEKCNSK